MISSCQKNLTFLKPAMPPKKKKGGGVASIRDCANCGATEGSVDGSPVHKTCGRCQIPYYCGKGCQKKHWRGGHKHVCIAPEDRKESQQPDSKAAAEGDECCICLEVMTEDQKLFLDCGHIYHLECINQLRKMGVQLVCPLCRADLPDSPEKMFSDGCLIYYQLNNFSNDIQEWSPKNKKEQNKIDELYRLFEGAAIQGHQFSQFLLWVMYTEGKGGIPQNDVLAMEWCRKAAEQGHAGAQFYLGTMYKLGRGGLSQSDVLAEKWYRKAAVQGQSHAQFLLGSMYRNGSCGLPQNDVLAMEWYRKAADQGDPVAQYNLGIMYQNGEGGLPQSNVLAMKWYQKAADQGHVEAQQNLLAMLELKKILTLY